MIDDLIQVAIRFFKNPPIIFFFALFTVCVYISNPSSFLESWNDGNGALIVLVPLLILEIWGKSFDRFAGRVRVVYAYLAVFLGGLSIFLIMNTGLRVSIINSATGLGANVSIAEFSWVQAMIYLVSTAVVSLLSILSGKRVVLPSIYTSALMLFLTLDTFFPYNEIGVLQYWVNPVLQFSALVINSFGLAHAYAYENLLRLANSTGYTTLAVYWPSAGIEGMIIAVLIVAGFSMKMNVKTSRIVAYLLAALLVSYVANSLRIIVLSLYVLQDVSNLNAFERFHSFIGDAIFFPWLALLLFLIYRREVYRDGSRKGYHLTIT
ncbi:MAG: exosortase/archaeosortase family protein, partial [Conexivisphaerales archaeon]